MKYCRLFFRTWLSGIAKIRSDCDLTEDWPNSQDIDILCKKAVGLFIYASTAIKFITYEHDALAERLALIISLPQSTVHEGKSGTKYQSLCHVKLKVMGGILVECSFHHIGEGLPGCV